MKRPGLCRGLTVIVTAGACVAGLVGSPGAHAASIRQVAPPGVDTAHPTVSGRLVAKATKAGAPLAPVTCSDRASAVRPVMVNRGLVVCTAEGNLVLVQLSAGTGLFNSNWHRVGYNQLTLGDHLAAWGNLRDNGSVVDPTVAVQDLSKSDSRVRTVAGRLVAMPDSPPSGPVICGDRDRAPEAQGLMATRGLVVCTEEGNLVLLEISSKTRIDAHDRTLVTLRDLTLGDYLTARGTLVSNGQVLNPTIVVMDANIQRKNAASQDFIANSGQILTLYVLKSDNGPVQGLVHAAPGEPSRITLCNGSNGIWRDLKQGLTINITNSIFNSRTMTYVDTNRIVVANCR